MLKPTLELLLLRELVTQMTVFEYDQEAYERECRACGKLSEGLHGSPEQFAHRRCCLYAALIDKDPRANLDQAVLAQQLRHTQELAELVSLGGIRLVELNAHSALWRVGALLCIVVAAAGEASGLCGMEVFDGDEIAGTLLLPERPYHFGPTRACVPVELLALASRAAAAPSDAVLFDAFATAVRRWRSDAPPFAAAQFIAAVEPLQKEVA